MTILVAQSPPGKSNDESFTPECVLERVRRVGPIGLDPCTTLGNPTKAAYIAVRGPASPMEISRSDTTASIVAINGLGADFSWAKALERVGGLAFVNPPYSRGNLLAWMLRCAHEASEGAEIIALPLCDPSALWWHQFCVPPRAAAVCFWRGRLTFAPSTQGAFFPSAVIYYGPRRYRFADAFSDAGAIWM